MEVYVKKATSESEIQDCKKLLHQIYGAAYGVEFSEGPCHPDLKIEPYPDSFVMGLVGDELAVIGGLYLKDTYAERFGGVDWELMGPHLQRRPGGLGRSQCVFREYGRLAVKEEYRSCGLGNYFCAITHSHEFVGQGTDLDVIMLISARRSIFGQIHDRHSMQTHYIKDFPIYKAHQNYAKDTDPVEIRYMAMPLDVPPRLRDLKLNRKYLVEEKRNEDRALGFSYRSEGIRTDHRSGPSGHL